MLSGAARCRYIIQIAGHLDPDWSAWFDGLEITHNPDGSTYLIGDVTDQAALYGLLARMRDLGLTLLSIQRTEPNHQAE